MPVADQLDTILVFRYSNTVIAVGHKRGRKSLVAGSALGPETGVSDLERSKR
jgi:hypothetical protein